MLFSCPRTSRRTTMTRRLGVERLEDRCQPSTGVLDPSFGTGGVVTPAISPTAVIVQPWNGDIVLAGYSGSDMALARYNPNGTLDTTFGTGGKEVSAIAGTAGGAAQYPQAGTANDGKIVEASGSTVARFNANGTLDTSFGTNGKVTLPWSGADGSVVIQADGKVLVSGVVGTTTRTMEVTRLNTNGSVDTSFGTTGTWATGINSSSTFQQHLVGYATLKANGELLAAVPYGTASGYGWVVLELTTSGALDPTFTQTITRFSTIFSGPNGVANPAGVAVYPASDPADAGKVLAVGYVAGPTQDIGATVLARYSANGTFDTTFGTAGKEIGANSGSSGKITGIAIQANGQVIVVGTTMQRYNINGTLDTSFGSGGIVSTAYAAVAIQPDGRIDAAASTALARYLASEPEIGSFTASANPVPSASNETLTVSNIADGNPGSVNQVEFYYIDGAGTQQVLGYGTQTSPGVWSLTFNVGMPTGSYSVYAQAEDGYDVFGDPIALTLQVL